jgi:hypothetical protein
MSFFFGFSKSSTVVQKQLFALDKRHGLVGERYKCRKINQRYWQSACPLGNLDPSIYLAFALF